jgi:hypothetical protein
VEASLLFARDCCKVADITSINCKQLECIDCWTKWIWDRQIGRAQVLPYTKSGGWNQSYWWCLYRCKVSAKFTQKFHNSKSSFTQALHNVLWMKNSQILCWFGVPKWFWGSISALNGQIDWCPANLLISVCHLLKSQFLVCGWGMGNIKPNHLECEVYCWRPKYQAWVRSPSPTPVFRPL